MTDFITDPQRDENDDRVDDARVVEPTTGLDTDTYDQAGAGDFVPGHEQADERVGSFVPGQDDNAGDQGSFVPGQETHRSDNDIQGTDGGDTTPPESPGPDEAAKF